MTGREQRIALDDGAFTTLERWGEIGPLVLAIHGMTSSRKSWERLAEHLAGRYRVAAYDQRGHGDSAVTPGPMSLARGERDLANVMDALGETAEVLIGHSWGGAIAIEAGARLQVARVAAIDPMIRQAGTAWYEEYLAELRELFTLHGPARDARTRADYATWHPTDVDAKVHAVHDMTEAPIEALLTDNPPASWDLRPTIARYDKPLLLAMAAADEGINDGATVEAIESRRTPNVEIVTFPGAGHNVHRTDFGRFAEALDRFLAPLVGR